MARGINKVTLIGNLGRDPEVRSSQNGLIIATVSIATTEAWKDRATGQLQEKTEWHRVVFFGRLAEIVRDYLKKGSKVYVEGRLQTRKWTDQQNIERYTTEIVANEMQMLDSRGAGSGGSNNDYQVNDNYNQEPMPSTASAPSDGGSTASFNDDDIPF